MASTLRYDTEVMRSQATRYQQTATKMREIKADLNRSIDTLVADFWQSEAGDAFKETYSSDWGENVDKYVAVLEEFAKMLREAAEEYDQVTRTAQRISL